MTTRYSGRIDLAPKGAAPAGAQIATPEPPQPSFVSLGGAYRPASQDDGDKQLARLLDTHRWIHPRGEVKSERKIIPRSDSFSRKNTLPD